MLARSRPVMMAVANRVAISAYVLAMLTLLWEITRHHQPQPVIIGRALGLGGD
jgi:hypothetical protein